MKRIYFIRRIEWFDHRGLGPRSTLWFLNNISKWLQKSSPKCHSNFWFLMSLHNLTPDCILDSTKHANTPLLIIAICWFLTISIFSSIFLVLSSNISFGGWSVCGLCANDRRSMSLSSLVSLESIKFQLILFQHAPVSQISW